MNQKQKKVNYRAHKMSWGRHWKYIVSLSSSLSPLSFYDTVQLTCQVVGNWSDKPLHLQHVSLCHSVCLHLRVSICILGALPPLFSSVCHVSTDERMYFYSIHNWIHTIYTLSYEYLKFTTVALAIFVIFPRFSQWLRGAALNCTYKARHRLNSA